MIVRLYPPYSHRLSIRGASAYSVLGKVENGIYRRLFRAGAGAALIEFHDIGTPDDPAVRVDVAAHQGAVDDGVLWSDVLHVLNPARDHRPFLAYASDHPPLDQVIAPLIGLHSFRFERLFDALMVTLIEQQISLRAAQLAERFLCQWGGDTLDYGGHSYYTFPSVERIASATVEDLTPTKITFIRMRRLIDVARRVVAGEIDLEALRDAPNTVRYPQLVGLHGVGHWTAAWATIRAAGEYLYIGRADVALRTAVNRYFFGKTGRIDVDTMDQLYAGYAEYGAIAAYYTIMRYALDLETL